jgi:uncharacterized protein
MWKPAMFGAVAVGTVVLLYILFVEASPPAQIVIAAGSKEGAYYRIAEKYVEELKRHGIRATVRETKGSGENLKLLSEPGGDVSVALVQGGMADPSHNASLRALGSLYREPLWIFLRRDIEANRLSDLKGLRIAVGAEGSGTRRVAVQLLVAAGVKEESATFTDAAGMQAAEQLESGSLDAACFVAGIEASYVQYLGHSSQAHLMSIQQQHAVVRRFRQYSAMTLPAGMLDLENHLPPQDTVLVGPAALLVVRSALHPAVASVLLETARRVHNQGDALSAPREFPSQEFVDLPFHEEAERYFRHGPPLLQRILPFWLATFIDRVKFLALPLIMLAMPLFRAAPPLLRWRTRRKVYLWYGRLRELDYLIAGGMSADEARERLAELGAIEEQISRVAIPLSYMEEYYHLREHLRLVQEGLEAIIAGRPFGNIPIPPATDKNVSPES